MDRPQATVQSGLEATCADSRVAVLDTNVVLDWLLWKDASTAGLSQAAAEGRLRWVWTARMRAELVHVLAQRLPNQPSARREAALQAADAKAVLWDGVEPVTAATMRCRDPSDQMFIDLAAALSLHAPQAVTLVSRDRAVLAVGKRARAAGFVVCTPAGFATGANAVQPPAR